MPMAGRGSRFADAGYEAPKPLIPVLGRPMIELVVENLRPSVPHRFVFICQAEHVARYDLGTLLPRIAPGAVVVPLDGITEGAAVTVLHAREHIDPDDPLVIANSDQYVDVPADDWVSAGLAPDVDGLILTMEADDPKWSFVELDDAGLVTRVVEKEVVSDQATVGIYLFARGRDFVDAADAMIAADERVNGEFYVAPVYNGLIRAGHRVVVHDVGQVGAGMHGLGTPADLDAFLASATAARLGTPA
ncbi:dTDP-glucose pyrophosphorylase [Cellulomonas marina]|uniref:dTDP-glucose pyrophosphorylase n=1 Tax=Cellulomonas marina TaxID=988821 RepID=A0A1I0UYN9_9CELL|nr:dTDP-glucose pyrophosphorylase [Cellulomonas marina]